MYRDIYNKTLKLASHRKSKSFLGFISFIESFVFRIDNKTVQLNYLYYLNTYIFWWAKRESNSHSIATIGF